MILKNNFAKTRKDPFAPKDPAEQVTRKVLPGILMGGLVLIFDPVVGVGTLLAAEAGSLTSRRTWKDSFKRAAIGGAVGAALTAGGAWITKTAIEAQASIANDHMMAVGCYRPGFFENMSDVRLKACPEKQVDTTDQQATYEMRVILNGPGAH